jgi:hypothetical protein
MSDTVAQTPRTRSPLLVLVLGLAVAALAAILFRFNPALGGFYPVCMFHQMTGLQCPGCGGLRAVHQLLHGHLLTALQYNPLFVLSAPWLGYVCFRNMRAWAAGEPIPAIRWPGRSILILAVVLFGFTILRNLPWVPFTWLSPPS